MNKRDLYLLFQPWLPCKTARGNVAFYLWLASLFALVGFVSWAAVANVLNIGFGFALIMGYLLVFSLLPVLRGAYWPCHPKWLLGCLTTVCLAVGILLQVFPS